MAFVTGGAVKEFDGSLSRPHSVVIQSASNDKHAHAPPPSPPAQSTSSTTTTSEVVRSTSPRVVVESTPATAPVVHTTTVSPAHASAPPPVSPRGKPSSGSQKETIHLDGDKKEKGFKGFLKKLDNLDKKLGGQGGLAE